MADQKISELTALTGANVADDDAIAIVDTSATETKKIVFSELKNALDTATGFVRITGDTMTGALDVQSTITADGLTVDGNGTTNVISGGGANDVLAVKSTDNTSALSLVDTNGSAKILTQSDGRLRFYRDGDANSITSANSKLALSLEANGDISFYEDTGTTPKMVWKSADERLGIGTSSPIDKLNITGGGASIEGSVSGFTGGEVLLGNTTANTQSAISTVATGTPQMYFDHRGTSTGQWVWRSSLSERMRIDSSGNLLVGTTDTTPFNNSAGTSADFGFVVNKGGGYTSLASYNTTPLYINRTSSDGDIVNFRKDGAPVGSIGTQNGSDFYIGSSPATIGLRFQTNEIVPVSAAGANKDAAIDVGKSNIRFKDLYLSGGVYLGDTGAANKLDDYEEGNHQTTITPSLSGSVSLPSSADNIAYTKVGRLVTVSGDIRTNGVSSPVGNSRISLPFAVADLLDLGERGGGVMAVWNGSSWTQQIYTFAASDSFFVVQIVPTATLEFRFSFSYFTS